MALIVEDGTIVDNANSYVTREELIDYAALRGVVLADVDATDVFAIRAMDYLATYDGKWLGEVADPAQVLAWPRNAVYPYGRLKPMWPINQIPGDIKAAQLELALQANAGIVLVPTTSSDTAFVTKEKVDVIETEYSEAVKIKMLGMMPIFPLVNSRLSRWLNNAIGQLRTVRV